AGKGFTHLRGSVAIENREITSDLNPRLRFFVFDQEPNMERLTPVSPETPLPAAPPPTTASETVERIFQYTLSRPPSAAEAAAAMAAMEAPSRKGHISAQGLADLLWAVLMKPEFQLID